MTPKELALKAAEILDNKKAEDIKVIEVTEQTIVADYFVLANGTSSTPQTRRCLPQNTRSGDSDSHTSKRSRCRRE